MRSEPIGLERLLSTFAAVLENSDFDTRAKIVSGLKTVHLASYSLHMMMSAKEHMEESGSDLPCGSEECILTHAPDWAEAYADSMKDALLTGLELNFMANGLHWSRASSEVNLQTMKEILKEREDDA